MRFSTPSSSFVSSGRTRRFPTRGDSASGSRGFPEGHPATPNRLKELDYLKRKVDAGADYICTQLFFSNADFYDFRERCELAGIRVPIIAGIMPITSKENLARMAELALGARFPARLLRAIGRCDDDPKAVAKVGVHWATEQCRDLLDNQVRGIHFYTLNRSDATRKIYENLGLTRRLALGHDRTMTPQDLTDRLKSEALRLGFDDVGIAPAVPAPGYPNFLEWLEAGHHAGMEYMSRHAASREHPGSVLEGVRSVVVVSIVYGRNEPRNRARPHRRKARWPATLAAADYHRVLWDKLEALLDWLRTQCPTIRGRAVVDTAPLLERDFARLAGLGWIGKNTMLISRRLGSFTFLGALLIDAELAYDPPHHREPLRNLHALPRRLPDPGVRRPLPARRPALHQLLDDRAQRRARRPGRGQSCMAGSLAATSARMSVPGTARPRRVAKPSSTRVRNGAIPT